MRENREQSRRQFELVRVHKEVITRRNGTKEATEEAGTESSVKHPEERGPLNCTKRNQFGTSDIEI